MWFTKECWARSVWIQLMWKFNLLTTTKNVNTVSADRRVITVYKSTYFLSYCSGFAVVVMAINEKHLHRRIVVMFGQVAYFEIGIPFQQNIISGKNRDTFPIIHLHVTDPRR